MDIENKLKSKKIETYADDMAKVIEDNQGGIIKKIIHEEEEHEAQKKNLSPKSKQNKLFMILSLVLLVIALAVLFFLNLTTQKASIVTVVPQSTPIIFVDKTDFISIDGLTKDKIASIISNQINDTSVKIGGIDAIYPTENKKIVGFSRFNSLLENNLSLNQPDLISESFLIGALNSGIKETLANAGDPFILLKIKSFADIFPSMRAWEGKMLYDLHGFFGLEISSDTNYLFTKDFEDSIVANKNARILKDNDGKIILMYVFVDDSHLIITNSEMATQEVILRLNSSQIKK